MRATWLAPVNDRENHAMRTRFFSVAMVAIVICSRIALAGENEPAAVQFDGDAQETLQESGKRSAEKQDVKPTSAETPIAEQNFVTDESLTPSTPQANKGGQDRYRFHNGRWWYQTDGGQWLWRDGSRWVPHQPVKMTAYQAQAAAPGAAAPQSGVTGQPLASQGFNSWFNAYRGFQTGRGALRTAESGQVEMATAEIGEAEAEGAEVIEFGGIPRSQARRRRPGVGTASPGSGSWFNSGSPFGIRYGYGSGFGYGGYGYDNPYGYGSRSGSGGAYGYGFGAFGSVGGQTGERLSSLISGPVEEGGRLIGSETASFAAPARLETAVGGSYGKAGAGARKLGGSASERE
jgi:hypothetical protein